MARDGAGAEWGRYHRKKAEKKRLAQAKKRYTPSLYLLLKDAQEHAGRLGSGVVIKVGRTQRNALIRHSEQSRNGFRLWNSWHVDPIRLNQIEAEVLKEFVRIFGQPIEGNETFYVNNIESAVKLIEDVVRKYAVSA